MTPTNKWFSSVLYLDIMYIHTYIYLHTTVFTCVRTWSHTKKASCIYVQRTQRLLSSLCQGVMHVMVKHLDSNVKNGLRVSPRKQDGLVHMSPRLLGKQATRRWKLVLFLMVGSMRKTCLNSTLGPQTFRVGLRAVESNQFSAVTRTVCRLHCPQGNGSKTLLRFLRHMFLPQPSKLGVWHPWHPPLLQWNPMIYGDFHNPIGRVGATNPWLVLHHHLYRKWYILYGIRYTIIHLGQLSYFNNLK